MNCPYCNDQVPPNVNNCPSCGAPMPQIQQPVQNTAAAKVIPSFAHSLWMSITSLCFGAFCLFGSFDDSEWDEDTAVGFLIFFAICLTFGIITIAKERNHKVYKGLAIAGVAAASLAFLIAL